MKRTVLLASCRVDVLATLPVTLKLAGLKVIVVDSGLDAIRKARSGWPDLIILDSTLPDMDGSTAADILRRLPSTADIPNVLLRATANHAGHEAGCNRTDLLLQVANVLSLCETRAPNRPFEEDDAPVFLNAL